MDFDGVRVSQESLLVSGIAQGAVASGFVDVSINGTVVSCLADRALSTAAGDLVYGRRLNGRILIEGCMWPAAPDAPDESATPPPAPEPVTRYGKTIIAPVETRTRRIGWRVASDDTFQGDYTGEGNNVGCAFYGTKPRSLAGATVTKATVRVYRLEGRGFTSPQETTLWRVLEKTRPTGDPTLLGGSIDGPEVAQGKSQTFTLPDSWGQDLVDGAAGGFAIYDASGSPYVRLAGRAKWAPAWTLTLEWKRDS
jgi:hypothetical protein